MPRQDRIQIHPSSPLNAPGGDDLKAAQQVFNLGAPLVWFLDKSGKALLWDAAACEISNSTKANDFLRREYRQGWTL